MAEPTFELKTDFFQYNAVFFCDSYLGLNEELSLVSGINNNIEKTVQNTTSYKFDSHSGIY